MFCSVIFQENKINVKKSSLIAQTCHSLRLRLKSRFQILCIFPLPLGRFSKRLSFAIRFPEPATPSPTNHASIRWSLCSSCELYTEDLEQCDLQIHLKLELRMI